MNQNIQQDIQDGICCKLCHRYFLDSEGDYYEHWQPVICDDCFMQLPEEEKLLFIKAQVKAW